MWEERDWTDLPTHLRELQDKANAYLGYILSGQLSANPVYANRPVEIELYCQHPPPVGLHPLLQGLRKHLSQHDIRFCVYLGFTRSHPLV
jgi:hypothetical protein